MNNKQPKYGEKQYIAGLNSRGLPSRKGEEPQVPSTERGKRRKTKPPHAHEWVARKFDKNTSYHEARITNESRFDCVCKNMDKPVHRGGGRRGPGCGASCKAPKA